MYNAKSRAVPLLLALMLAFVALPRVFASFSSFYVFGDGLSTTNEEGLPADDPLYYGKRYCNGRVWVELIWQWQGLAHDDSKNVSYFGNYSQDVVGETATFAEPPDVATALFAIWCNNADLVEFANTDSPPYSESNIPTWTDLITAAVSRHVQAVTNLYGKGARNFVMPNAVDISRTPDFNQITGGEESRLFIRDRVMGFNSALETAMADLETSMSGLKIYRPDTFGFFEQVLLNPEAFDLVNPYPNNAATVDLPVEDRDKETGPGVHYVFWDELHPTAKFQMHLAGLIQKTVFPVKVESIARAGGNVQLQVANVPFGRTGVIQGSADLQAPWADDWTIDEAFVESGSTTHSYSFPAVGPKRFYRVGFPVVWTWP